MAEMNSIIAENLQILTSLTPELRARTTVVRRTAFESALQRKLDLDRAKQELELIIKLCEEILNA